MPVFGLPDDLVEVRLEAFDSRYRGERLFGRVDGRRLVPYWRRAEIDAGRLAGRGLELAWARDPVDVFFMEIQGSGTLRFPDGREQRVGYAGANGRAYRAIGRLLIEEGRVPREAMSMQAIRAWLAANPGERQRVLQHNESFIFFRPLAGPPEGSLGRPLTPGRSIATDSRLFPPGALAFLDTEQPEQEPDGAVRWSRSRASSSTRTRAGRSGAPAGSTSSGGAGRAPPSRRASCGSPAASTSWCRGRRPSPRGSRARPRRRSRL